MLDRLTELVSDTPITYVVVLLAAAADVLFPVVPSEAMVFTAGVVAANGGLILWVLVPAVALGAMAGDNVSYWLGRRIGDPVAQRLFTSETSRRRLGEARDLIARHGAAIVVLGRFIPGGRTASTFASGMLEMPWRRFFLADAVAAFTWALYAVLLGYLGGEAFRDSLWQPIAMSLAIGLTLALAAEIWRRVQRRRGRDLLGHRLPRR
jgi:membrane protein DedA with SNARE-associated domain